MSLYVPAACTFTNTSSSVLQDRMMEKDKHIFVCGLYVPKLNIINIIYAIYY